MRLDREEKKFRDIKFASILGIFWNIFLLVIKGLIGIITSSQAMIADSINSAGDILSSIMTYVGNRIASKPSDDDHNLGHGKAEYIYSMLISLAMICTALIIFKDSVMVIVNNEKYNFSMWLIVVCLVTIIVKLGLFIYTYGLSKKHNNLLIKANSKDHICDCFVTGSNLIAYLMTFLGIYIFDGIVGVGISIWMLVSYIKIFLESYHVLMDKAMDEDTKNQVLDIVKEHKEIIKTNHFNSTPVGYKYQISLTIFVDGDLSTFESHDIANRLEKEIIKRVDSIYLAVIHVNPMEVKKTSE